VSGLIYLIALSLAIVWSLFVGLVLAGEIT
jgi:hypothetical protein